MLWISLGISICLWNIICAGILLLWTIYWIAYAIRVFLIARFWTADFVRAYGKWAERGMTTCMESKMGIFPDAIASYCPEVLLDVAAVVGILCAGILLLWTIYWIAYAIRVFLVARFWTTDFVKTYGKWAVVTGGSSGIGKQYALQFARRGMNVVIISENEKDLDSTAAEIKETFEVTVKTMLADLSQGQTAYSTIEKEIKDIEIGILVNNVGVAPRRPMYFTEMSDDLIWRQILINVGAASHMTRIVLPHMMKRSRGAIINISSATAFVPWPLTSVYGASKIYVEYLSRCLQLEHKRYGITVQCVMPYFVNTNITGDDVITFAKRTSSVPSAETFVRSAVTTLGHTSCTTGYWLHGLQYLMFNVFCAKSVQVSYLSWNGRSTRRLALSREVEIKSKFHVKLQL